MLRSVILSTKVLAGGPLMVGLSIVALLSVTDVVASKRVRQPTRDDLATVWVGGSGRDSLEFFRLELDARGTGLLTVQYLPDGPASAYKIRGTTLAGYAITLDVEPMDDSAQRLELRGEATANLLRLDVKGRTPDWTRHVELQRYDELLRRIKVVTEKAEAASR